MEPTPEVQITPQSDVPVAPVEPAPEPAPEVQPDPAPEATPDPAPQPDPEPQSPAEEVEARVLTLEEEFRAALARWLDAGTHDHVEQRVRELGRQFLGLDE